MANFCQNCGAALSQENRFCPSCGAAQNTVPQPQPQTYAPQQNYVPVYQTPSYAGKGEVREGIPVPGFSDRVNHPEIIAAVKKNRRAAGIFSVFLVPLPLIGFIIYSMFNDELETSTAAMYGAIVSGIFLLFALYGFLKQRASNAYEATVIDKKTRRRHHNNNSDNEEFYTEFIVVVRTTDGKKKKIIENDGSQLWAWNYLNVGDRFKYHPQFNFPYELYDKTRAPYIACVSCPEKNSIEADRCHKCGLPLLK